MIKVVTKSNDTDTIKDVDAFFMRRVLAKDFDAMALEAIQRIDDAVLIDRELGTIRTKLGVTDVLHLSTGAKVVLSYLYIHKRADEYKNKVLNITECGYNALEVLFDIVDRLHDSTTIFLLEHSNQLYDCTNREFCVNGEVVSSLDEGVILYG